MISFFFLLERRIDLGKVVKTLMSSYFQSLQGFQLHICLCEMVFLKYNFFFFLKYKFSLSCNSSISCINYLCYWMTCYCPHCSHEGCYVTWELFYMYYVQRCSDLFIKLIFYGFIYFHSSLSYIYHSLHNMVMPYR